MSLAVELTRADKEALGGCRDVLTSLQNLYALLRSPKVGPKALKPLLPDVRKACEDLGGALRFHVEAQPQAGDSILMNTSREVLHFVLQLTTQMADALRVAEASSMEARARLALEAKILAVAPQLDTSRVLVDLLVASGEGATLEVELSELLDEALLASSRISSPWLEPVHIRARLPGHGCVVETRPRVVIPRITFAISQLLVRARKSISTPAPVFFLDSHCVDGQMTVSVEVLGANDERPYVLEADSLVLRCPALIPPCEPVLAVAESSAKMFLLLDESNLRAEIVFERGAVCNP